VKLRNLTLAGIAAACLGVATLASAAPAGAAAEHYDTTARAAIAAAAGPMKDNYGASYGIACTMPGEGGLAGTVTSDPSQITLASSDGGAYDYLKCASGDCLKYNASSGGYVYGNAACNTSNATWWDNTGDGVWANAYCQANGITCNLRADDNDASPDAPTDLMAVGGTWPGWTNHWTANP